jgi:hypothetical protein
VSDDDDLMNREVKYVADVREKNQIVTVLDIKMFDTIL